MCSYRNTKRQFVTLLSGIEAGKLVGPEDSERNAGDYMTARKLVESREPNGRRQRSNEREFSPTQVRRLRDAAMAGLRDPEWGTHAGRLFLDGTLTAEMYAAAKWWREMAAKYRVAICAPPPQPKALNLEAGRGSSSIDPDSEGQGGGWRPPDTVKVFEGPRGALISAGMMAERTVRRLCEQDEAPVGEQERQWAICGLRAAR
jgi:hypothetical protein